MIPQFLLGLTIYNKITIVLVILFILSSIFLHFLRKAHDKDPEFLENQRKRREAYEKRMREEADSLIASANSGMDMGDDSGMFSDSGNE